MERGQLELSFGMIFSIIIIIATIGIAIYFIVHFLNTSQCAQIGLFKSDLQDSIDQVWKSAQSNKQFQISLPTKITEVCIGNPQNSSQFRRFSRMDYNLFLLPSAEACDGNSAAMVLKHIETSSFVCVNITKGKGSIYLIKESASQSLVRISK